MKKKTMTLESSHSGDYFTMKRWGRIDHTNGYFRVERLRPVGKAGNGYRVFFFSQLPKGIVREIDKGTPHCCGVAEFNLKLLDQFLDSKVKK